MRVGSDSTLRPSIARPQSLSARARMLLLILGALWVAALAYGVIALRTYESTPGATGLTPTIWPAASQITPDPSRASLVMLVHPQCSCTRASLEELNAIMNQSKGRVSAWVLFIKPTGIQEGWERSATWTEAHDIPGVTVLVDKKGAEASRFGALTSGHIVLYDRNGHLMFSGGITSARGHAGDNLGRQSILALLDGNAARHRVHEVYGCPLSEETVTASNTPRLGNALNSTIGAKNP
jgi:hypothetical protein